MYVCMYVCIYIYTHVSLSLSLYIYIYIYVYPSPCRGSLPLWTFELVEMPTIPDLIFCPAYNIIWSYGPARAGEGMSGGRVHPRITLASVDFGGARAGTSALRKAERGQWQETRPWARGVASRRVDAILCYTMLCHTILCYAMLCYAILYYYKLYYDTIRYDTIRYDTVLYYTIILYSITYYDMIHCDILYNVRCRPLMREARRP